MRKPRASVDKKMGTGADEYVTNSSVGGGITETTVAFGDELVRAYF